LTCFSHNALVKCFSGLSSHCQTIFLPFCSIEFLKNDKCFSQRLILKLFWTNLLIVRLLVIAFVFISTVQGGKTYDNNSKFAVQGETPVKIAEALVYQILFILSFHRAYLKRKKLRVLRKSAEQPDKCSI